MADLGNAGPVADGRGGGRDVVESHRTAPVAEQLSCTVAGMIASKGGTGMPSDERMGTPDNPWDRLSDYFDTSKDEDEIPAGAADNILIAWPVFFRFIETHISTVHGKCVLDYGCGAGGFAHRLCTYGCHVTGVDASRAMIEKATRAYGDAVDFRVGDSALLCEPPPFALITSIMALQFVADIEPLLADFAVALDMDGHLIFAVHNPAFYSGETLRFSNGVTVPIFIRGAEEYHAIARQAGFEPLLEEYPPFTEEFIARYPTYADRLDPEYLILGYRKGGRS
jgi:SAM-dependent methyltransferase